MKPQKENKKLTSKELLIGIILTTLIGLGGTFGFSINGWLQVTTSDTLPLYNSVDQGISMCSAVGKYFPPLGFPFKYLVVTNMSEFFPNNSFPVSLWHIGACGTPVFINPLAFLANLLLILSVTYLFLKSKKK